MRKIKILVVGLVLLAASVVGICAMQPVMAATKVTCPTGTLNEKKKVDSLAECNIEQTTGDKSLMSTVSRGINLAIAIAGILAVVMIIVGGIMMTTSSGDAAKVKKAKDTILYGVVGLVIALLAYAIVNFVLGSLFSTKSTETEDETSLVINVVG